MFNFRINSIRIHNFKGIDDLTVNLQSQVAVLGGKNGYGKTTLFDALELLFTGRIERYQYYQRELHNNRLSLDNEYALPLVSDRTKGDVCVQAELTYEGQLYSIRRKASPDRLTNPISFEPFNVLEYECEPGKWLPVDGTDKNSIREVSALQTIFSDKYGFLHYLSQDESLDFLRQSEGDRIKQLQTLFGTADFDEKLDAAKKIREVYKKLREDYKTKREELNKQILRYTEKKKGDAAERVPYQQLFTRLALNWDKETPSLSEAEYDALLSDGGTLYQLSYYVQNKSELKIHLHNKWVREVLEDAFFSDLCFYIVNQNKEREIQKAKLFYSQVYDIVKKWTIDHTPDCKLNLSEEYLALVGKEALDALNVSYSKIADIYNRTNELSRFNASMSMRRNKLIEDADKWTNSQCPVCGQNYDTTRALRDAIAQYGEMLNAQASEMSKILSDSFETYKSQALTVLSIVVNKFNEQGIDQNIVQRYNELNVAELKSAFERVCQTYELSFLPTMTIEEVEMSLRDVLILREEDSTLDMGALLRIHKAFSQDKFDLPFPSAGEIEKKKQYLSALWRETISQRLIEMQREEGKYGEYYSKANSQYKTYCDLIKSVEKQKKEYVDKMIADMEILFYIYTGRIMQDCHFGRGVFLKNDTKRILFVSGNYKEDVDVLYKMSSGQLAAIVIAFMLTINKLYTNKVFVAIDDPVQTIDDMNMWGLIETIRHEFPDVFMLMSTHEEKYATILCDKFKAWDISTKYINLQELRANEKKDVLE